MPVLLRCPAAVPALFSSSDEADLPTPRTAWRRLSRSTTLLAVSGWAAAMLIDVPLVRAAGAVAGLVAPR